MRSTLLIIASSIFVLGLIMIFSTTSAEVLDLDLDKSTHQALYRQLVNFVLGALLAGWVYKIGYHRFLARSPVVFFFFCGLLILVLIPGIGSKVNGSRRWLSLAGFSFQPSEFVKYFTPAYFIHHIIKTEASAITFKAFAKLTAVSALPIVLIMIEPNNGTAGVIGICLIVLFFLTRIPFKYWAVPLGIFVVAGGIFASQLPYVQARLKVYFHPELDLKGKGHQPYQAKIAAGSGQMFGKGPGNSLQKLSYLPEAQNDYIAAIYAEEFGFAGILVLITLYASLGMIGFMIAQQARDLGGFYFAGVISFLYCFQAFLNMGVVSGLLPSTGLNLPLFSQGGTSLMANIMGLGFLLSIANANEENICQSA